MNSFIIAWAFKNHMLEAKSNVYWSNAWNKCTYKIIYFYFILGKYFQMDVWYLELLAKNRATDIYKIYQTEPFVHIWNYTCII